MKTAQYYFSKLGSRKFQMVVLGTVLFFLKPAAFTADHLIILICAYLGMNVVDKFLQGRNNKNTITMNGGSN